MAQSVSLNILWLRKNFWREYEKHRKSKKMLEVIHNDKNVFRVVCFKYSSGVTLSQRSPGFYMSAVQVSLKTLWEKEELLEMSNFFFFQCFLPVWRTFFHFNQIWNCRLQFLSIWKSLKFVFWERVNESIGLICKGKRLKDWSSDRWCLLLIGLIDINIFTSVLISF